MIFYFSYAHTRQLKELILSISYPFDESNNFLETSSISYFLRTLYHDITCSFRISEQRYPLLIQNKFPCIVTAFSGKKMYIFILFFNSFLHT